MSIINVSYAQRTSSSVDRADLDEGKDDSGKGKRKSLKDEPAAKKSRKSLVVVKENLDNAWRTASLKLLEFFFSHVGLCLLVIGYAIAGGYLFEYLEGPREAELSKKVYDERLEALNQLLTMTDMMMEHLNYINQSLWRKRAVPILHLHETKVLQASKSGWNGRIDANVPLKWNYPSALLYSVTLITTIGYGHVTPNTTLGKAITIGYALLGIPLMFLWLNIMSHTLDRAFRFAYKNVTSFLGTMCCAKKKPVKEPMRPSRTPSRSKSQSHSGKSTSSNPTSQTLHSANESVRNHSANESVRSKTSRRNTQNNAKSPTEDRSKTRQQSEVIFSPSRVTKPVSNKDIKSMIRVPYYITTFVVLAYIFLGALLFSYWEDDWDYFIGAYFCFVTLTTIGLGDYVFGTGEDGNAEKYAISNLYVLIGLAVIAMCFQLLQAEVTLFFRIVGKKFGKLMKKKRKSTKQMERDL